METPANAIASGIHTVRTFGTRFGVTRVTDITRLDCLGIPVYAAIRPTGVPGSLCVHAGKGLTSSAAEMGAWMEAIEFALAEPGVSPVETVLVRPEEIRNGKSPAKALLDFCPLLGTQIPEDILLPCVRAQEIYSGGFRYIPAERVFVPAPPEVSSPLFGYSTTGIAAGMTRLDAMIH